MTGTEIAYASGVHYGRNQPRVNDKHLAREAATRFGSANEQAAFVRGFKAAVAGEE